MSDVIKFRCRACEKKITVRAEYAGKKAKCPGCKQPLRVPSPRPKRSSTGVPVATGGSSAPSPGRSAVGVSLSDLAAMEANADAELIELSPKAANRPNNIRIEGGKDCPNCGASVKPDAVICVHCGHNFESGKRLKTKKDSKVGNAVRSVAGAVTEPDEEDQATPWKTLLSSAVFLIFGGAVAFYDYRPDDEDYDASDLDVMIAFAYDNIGQYPTAGILFFIGLCFGAMGVRAFMR